MPRMISDAKGQGDDTRMDISARETQDNQSSSTPSTNLNTQTSTSDKLAMTIVAKPSAETVHALAQSQAALFLQAKQSHRAESRAYWQRRTLGKFTGNMPDNCGHETQSPHQTTPPPILTSKFSRTGGNS